MSPLRFPGALQVQLPSTALEETDPITSGTLGLEEKEEKGLVISLLFRVRLSFEMRTLFFLLPLLILSLCYSVFVCLLS